MPSILDDQRGDPLQSISTAGERGIRDGDLPLPTLSGQSWHRTRLGGLVASARPSPLAYPRYVIRFEDLFGQISEQESTHSSSQSIFSRYPALTSTSGHSTYPLILASSFP